MSITTRIWKAFKQAEGKAPSSRAATSIEIGWHPAMDGGYPPGRGLLWSIIGIRRLRLAPPVLFLLAFFFFSFLPPLADDVVLIWNRLLSVFFSFVSELFLLLGRSPSTIHGLDSLSQPIIIRRFMKQIVAGQKEETNINWRREVKGHKVKSFPEASFKIDDYGLPKTFHMAGPFRPWVFLDP